MDLNTGIAVINELTDLRRRMTVELEPIRQRVFTYVQSLDPNISIISEDELLVATGIEDFTEMRNDVLQMSGELIRDAREFGDGVVTAQILERKDEIIGIYEQANETLAETRMRHRELMILARDYPPQIAQNLLPSLSDLQETSSDILRMIRTPNNHVNLRAQIGIWRDKINTTLSALTDTHTSIPAYRLQQNKLEQLKVLLLSVELLHRPPWYFQFVEAVGGNSIEEIQQFRVNIEEYNTRLAELYTGIEQFLEY